MRRAAVTLALIFAAACSRSELYGPDDVPVDLTGGGGGAGGGASGGGQGGGGAQAGGGAGGGGVCGGGPMLGDPSCKTCWDHGTVVSNDGQNVAYLPICGNDRCLPIITSGHPAPSYSAPTSTCDLLPPAVISQCPKPFTCACLSPLLSQGAVWPFSQWNCSWFCTSKSDGSVDQLHCSVP